MIGHEILKEIDETLDQLIINAEMVNEIDFKDLSELEKEVFQKTQENLLFHLMFMDHRLEEKRSSLKKQSNKSGQYQIQRKLLHLKKLQPGPLKKMSREYQIIRKVKTKRPKGKKI